MTYSTFNQSPSIAALDANILNEGASQQNTAGQGGPAYDIIISDSVTPGADVATTVAYQMVRVPSTACLKHVFFESGAQAAGAVQISVYYSDNKNDGTAAANATTPPTIVPTTGSEFISSPITVASAVLSSDVINKSGNNPTSNRNLPLWDALGLTSDPGGFFDIVLEVTTEITTGTAAMGITVHYTA